VHVARIEKIRNIYEILVGKTEGKRPFGRQTQRRQNHMRMDLGETKFVGVDYTHLGQDRDLWRAVVNTVMNLKIPQRWGIS
jgi:hypothetical protein